MMRTEKADRFLYVWERKDSNMTEQQHGEELL